nr:hypothetical protein [Tanacetum cinerariifolium]
MRKMGKTIGELHALLIEYEKGLPKKAAIPQVLAIQDYGILVSKNDVLYFNAIPRDGKPFPHQTERATDLLGLMHTDVCGPLRHVSRQGASYFITFTDDFSQLRVTCYCDAGFETNRDDIKSQTRYVFVLNGGTVDWKSSKQRTTTMSAIEAEYIATSEAAMEAVWIKKFISELGIVPTINNLIKMYYDNSVALLIANELRVQKGAVHYHRRYHNVREYIKLGKIYLFKVHTDSNLVDLFTKALPKEKLTLHDRSIGLRLTSSFM